MIGAGVTRIARFAPNDVRHYGAVEGADAAPAFAAALAANGTVFVPDGTWDFYTYPGTGNAGVYVPAGKRLVGQSQNGTILRRMVGTGLESVVSLGSGASVSDMTISGNATTYGPYFTTPALFQAVAVNSATAERITVIDWTHIGVALFGTSPTLRDSTVIGLRMGDTRPDGWVAAKSCTITASTDVVACTGHGFSIGDQVCFPSLTGATGLVANTVGDENRRKYYVISSGFTTDAFKVSETSGGAAVDVTVDGTGTVADYPQFEEAACGYFGVWVGVSTTRDARIVDCVIRDCHANGVYTEAPRTHIVGNTFTGNHLMARPTGGGQVDVDDGATDSLVADNVIDGTPTAITLATSAASDDIIDTATAHGFRAGQIVWFPALTGGSGLSALTPYWVVSTSLGTTTLRVSATEGGTPLGFTTDITAGTISIAPGNAYGIEVAAARASVVGNEVLNATHPGIILFTDDNKLTGNVVRDSDSSGIWVYGDGNSIVGGVSTGGLYGITIESGVSDLQVVGVDLRGNDTGTVNNLSANPVMFSGCLPATVNGSATYTASNVSTDRAYDADTVAVAELADVVGTLIADLRAKGIVL